MLPWRCKRILNFLEIMKPQPGMKLGLILFIYLCCGEQENIAGVREDSLMDDHALAADQLVCVRPNMRGAFAGWGAVRRSQALTA